jgi:hypothetical protein
MSFSRTLAGGGGPVIPASLPQEDSPATAIIVITRFVARINIDLIMFGLGGRTRLSCFWRTYFMPAEFPAL